jgi:hypothetical protein
MSVVKGTLSNCPKQKRVDCLGHRWKSVGGAGEKLSLFGTVLHLE